MEQEHQEFLNAQVQKVQQVFQETVEYVKGLSLGDRVLEEVQSEVDELQLQVQEAFEELKNRIGNRGQETS